MADEKKTPVPMMPPESGGHSAPPAPTPVPPVVPVPAPPTKAPEANDQPQKPLGSETAAVAQEKFDRYVTGSASGLTEKVAQVAQGSKADKTLGIDAQFVRNAAPIAVAGVAGLVGLYLLEPIQKGTDFIFGGIGKLVGKIPLIGDVLEEAISGIGTVVGYALPAVGALIGYKMFESDSVAKMDEAVIGDRHGTSRVGRDPKINQIVVNGHTTNLVEPHASDDLSAKDKMTPEENAKISTNGFDKLSEYERTKRMGSFQAGEEEFKELLRKYSGQQNQIYEDRRLVVERVAEAENETPRKNLVRGLQKTLGMNALDAQTLVPDGRKDMKGLTTHIYPNQTEGYKDIPQPLRKFGTDFIYLYANELDSAVINDGTRKGEKIFSFKDQIDGKEKTIGIGSDKLLFDQLTITQKMEFLDKAMAYVAERNNFYNDRHQTSLGGQSWDYHDYNQSNNAFQRRFAKTFGSDLLSDMTSVNVSGIPEGKINNSLSWRQDHDKIRNLLEQKYIEPDIDLHTLAYGLNQHTSGNIVELWNAWKGHQVEASKHMDSLIKSPGFEHLRQHNVTLEKNLDLFQHPEKLKSHSHLIMQQLENSQSVVKLMGAEYKDFSALLVGKVEGDKLHIESIRTLDAKGEVVTTPVSVADVNLRDAAQVKSLVASLEKHPELVVSKQESARQQRFDIGSPVHNSAPNPAQEKVGLTPSVATEMIEIKDAKTPFEGRIVAHASKKPDGSYDVHGIELKKQKDAPGEYHVFPVGTVENIRLDKVEDMERLAVNRINPILPKVEAIAKPAEPQKLDEQKTATIPKSDAKSTNPLAAALENAQKKPDAKEPAPILAHVSDGATFGGLKPATQGNVPPAPAVEHSLNA